MDVFSFQIADVHPAPLDGSPSTPAAHSDEAKKFSDNLKLLGTIAIIVGFFFIGWCPYVVLCNVISYNPIYYLRQPAIGVAHRISTYMLSLNCTVNPIIYGLRSKTFRRGFKLACSCSSDDETAEGAVHYRSDIATLGYQWTLAYRTIVSYSSYPQ